MHSFSLSRIYCFSEKDTNDASNDFSISTRKGRV
jgi:hypothetical protein